MSKTAIQWTDNRWNPVVGCSQVSPGCAHCYAKQLHDQRAKAKREGRGKSHMLPAQYDQPFETVQLMPDRLPAPLSWRKPKRVFVNSVSDLFHDDVPDEYIDRVFAVMALAPRHTFQILTKRATRMRDYMQDLSRDPAERLSKAAFVDFGEDADCTLANVINGWSWWRTMPPRDVKLDGSSPLWPLPNVWLGVSVENQRFANERIPLLMETPAAVCFLSCEPLLGPIDFTGIGKQFCVQAISKRSGKPTLDWIIVGGESGAGARACDLGWIRSIVAQCREGGVAPFVKQLGRFPRVEDGRLALRDSHGGDITEWPEDLRVREFPSAVLVVPEPQEER